MSATTLEQVAELRRGVDLDGTGNPAGSLFSSVYVEHEIARSRTGGTEVGGITWESQWADPTCVCCD